MKIHSKIFTIILAVATFFVAFCLFCGCSDDVKPVDNIVTVTLLNGEHYSVSGENKKVVADGGKVSFSVTLDDGYKITGANGDKLQFTDELSFKQTVTFDDVRYKTVARLETAPMRQCAFEIVLNNSDGGSVSVQTVLGNADENVYYEDDIISLSVAPNSGYRFLCWSTDNFLNDGGSFFSYETSLADFDFNAYSSLYANFKDITNTENSVYYRFENGVEIEQDCTALLAHHARANTLTAAEVKSRGVDFGERMLAGWQTESGEYIELGSRVTVSKTNVNILLPVWKEYTAQQLFTVTDDGKITNFRDDANDGEVVIPQTIENTTVIAIGEKAFEGCMAKSYYLPDTVTTVENNAFLNCKSLTEFYMSDNIVNIDDRAFAGCENFTTLHLNAVLKPRYVTSDSVKSEIYDKLICNADNGRQKLAMFGGSSVRYGYSEKTIISLFNQAQINAPQVYNFGYTIYTSAYSMFELAKPYLREGDIVLHAPEIAARAWSGVLSTSWLTNDERLEVNNRLFAIAESNWGLLANLTVNKYYNIFYQLRLFNSVRVTMRERDYVDYYKYADDNSYGVRESNEIAYKENGENKSFGNDGHLKFNIDLSRGIQTARDNMYKYLNDIGVRLFISFASINRHNLLITYNDELSIEKAAYEHQQYVISFLSDINYTMLLSQYDTVYDGRHFSNSDYHLGDPFRDEHTTKVISAMIAELKKESEVAV